MSNGQTYDYLSESEEDDFAPLNRHGRRQNPLVRGGPFYRPMAQSTPVPILPSYQPAGPALFPPMGGPYDGSHGTFPPPPQPPQQQSPFLTVDPPVMNRFSIPMDRERPDSANLPPPRSPGPPARLPTQPQSQLYRTRVNNVSHHHNRFCSCSHSRSHSRRHSSFFHPGHNIDRSNPFTNLNPNFGRGSGRDIYATVPTDRTSTLPQQRDGGLRALEIGARRAMMAVAVDLQMEELEEEKTYLEWTEEQMLNHELLGQRRLAELVLQLSGGDVGGGELECGGDGQHLLGAKTQMQQIRFNSEENAETNVLSRAGSSQVGGSMFDGQSGRGGAVGEQQQQRTALPSAPSSSIGGSAGMKKCKGCKKMLPMATFTKSTRAQVNCKTCRDKHNVGDKRTWEKRQEDDEEDEKSGRRKCHTCEAELPFEQHFGGKKGGRGKYFVDCVACRKKQEEKKKKKKRENIYRIRWMSVKNHLRRSITDLEHENRLI